MILPDLIAGLTVALFTVPQAMAYALIAGFPPSVGIITAIVASILGAAFGSSEFLVNGPTNAISVMLASNAAILASHGDPKQLVILLTLMIGVGQCIAATVRLGTFTRFVSEPVLVGFTAGAGIYIAVNQLPSALGLGKKDVVETLWGWDPPANCIFDLARALASLGKSNWVAFAVALGAFALVRILQSIEPKLKRRIPSSFLTVVIVSVIAYMLMLGDKSQGHHKIKLVQDIEPVTRQWPSMVWPQITWDRIESLLGPAFAIGLLGAVEAIAIGKSLASKVGHTFDANRQLIGEGVCNIGAALFGGFAASGSFTRTAVNFDSGAVSRISCIFSGLLVMLLILLFAPFANYIPIPALAGLLIHIGFKLVNVGKLKLIMETTVADRRALLWTFIAVLVVHDLAYALFIGVGISVFQALRRAEGFNLVNLVEDANGHLVERPEPPTGSIATLDLQGELFFAAADELEQRLKAIFANGAQFVVLRLQQAYNVDITCAEALGVVGREAAKKGGRLILSGVRPGMYGTLQRAGVIDQLGPESVFEHEPTLLGSTRRAIAFAQSLTGSANQLP
jgi:SulP family sulfate permease